MKPMKPMRAEGSFAPLARFQAGPLGRDDREVASGSKEGGKDGLEGA